MGVGERWINWSISIAKFSILVNGSPIGFFFFVSSRGLRQGDLSPYLFVIINVFSCLLKRAVSGGYHSSWEVRGRRGDEI